MWPHSSAVADALVNSCAVQFRVSATTPTQGTLGNLQIVSGSIAVTSTQVVRRTCTLELDPSKWPATVYDPFSPVGSEIVVEYGVGVAGGFEWLPVFTGPVQQAKTRFTSGGVTIVAASREQRIIDDRLDAPEQTVLGATAVAEITRLIQASIPGAVVIDETSSSAVAAQITVDRERWRDGIEKLADGIAAEVYCDPQGNFRIRNQPVLLGDPDLIIKTGEGGTLVDGDEELTRDKVYNRVIVDGIRSDGTPPVRSIVSDDDPSSPTYYGGAFGKKPRFYSSPLLTTTGQCTATGEALLARAKGMQSTITVEQVPHPALEAGDLIEVQLPDGRRQLHVVDGFNLPLTPEGTQKISSRSFDLPTETGS
jgi:hypothetical protein